MRSLYNDIASGSSFDPTTTAEPLFIKLTERSFVRIDKPRSPWLSTKNPFSFAILVILSTFSSTLYVGVIENVLLPLFLPHSSSRISSCFGTSFFLPVPHTEHSSCLNVLTDENS